MNEHEEIMKLYKDLIESKLFSFPKTATVNISVEQGVYIIYDLNKTVLHVGTTKGGEKGLNQRLNDHIKYNSSFSKGYLKPNEIRLYNDCNFKYIEIENPRKRVLLEALTTGFLCPAHIGTGERKIKL